ncbi:sulfite exporter TauE/SafE family protein [Georgenia sunbinii]|uniref:sulfite exporter TauE/SafE family protein n=1 Tax=Georgenia sunbinii TaxID=3117728 RepID=UPI002F26BDAE
MILAAAIGVLVGVVVGTLGAGGGILSFPILVYVLGFEPHAAAAASLVIVGASSLVSLLPHARAGHVNWTQGLAFGGLGSVGALAGAWTARLIDAELLMVLLAALLLAVATIMLRRSWRRARQERGRLSAAGTSPAGDVEADADDAGHRTARRRPLLTVVAASVAGLLTGLFGVGGGFIVVPALVLVMGVGMRAAVGTSLLVIAVNTVVGLAGRIGQSYPMDWWVVAAFAVTSMVGGLLGARLSTRAKPATLSLLFGLLLAAVAVATAVQAVPALIAG